MNRPMFAILGALVWSASAVAWAQDAPDISPALEENTPSAALEDVAASPAPQTGDAAAFRPWARVEAELIGGLMVAPSESWSAFEIERAELGLRTEPIAWAGAELRLESVRSASGGSLLGVDGNSMVVRVKRAQAYVHGELGPVHLEGRVGMIQDIWIEALEGQTSLRGFSPLTAESGDFFDTSDAGGSLVLKTGPQLLGGDAFRLALSLTNGEGRRDSERNRGKNITAVLSIQPVVAVLAGAPLRVGLHGAFRDGSAGTLSTRNHRQALALTANHERFEVGGEWIRAQGHGGDGTVTASGVGVWAMGQLIPTWLGAVVRYDNVNLDVNIEDAHRRSIQAALFTDVGLRARRDATVSGSLRFFLGVESLAHGENGGAIPGAPDASDSFRVNFWVASKGGLFFR